jgi:phosphatidylglycerol:prolipoprotein diacylglycerol transferase
MHPHLFGYEVYRPILALSVLVLIALLLVGVRRDGHPLRPVLVYLLLVGVAGLLGAKAFSILFHAGLRPLATELRGGLRFPGALLGVLASGWLLRGMLPAGLPLARLADLWAPCFSLACAIGRFGCLLMGCCYGAVAHLPFAIRYPRGSTPWWTHFDRGQIAAGAQTSLPVHAFPVYLMTLELALAAFAWWLLPRKAYDGQVLLVFLALHGTLKSVIELSRDPYDPLHQAAFPVAVAAAALLLVMQRRARRATAAAVHA